MSALNLCLGIKVRDLPAGVSANKNLSAEAFSR